MEDILEILKYVLPSVIVLLTAYFSIKLFLGKEEKIRLLEKRTANVQIVTPLRLQAYERIVLLLERISPPSLVMRVFNSTMTMIELQAALVQAVRDEFEHNLSQQVYISSQAWDYVKSAKEEVVKTINVAASGLDEKATATELSQAIFAESLRTNKPAISKALEFVKKEIRLTF